MQCKRVPYSRSDQNVQSVILMSAGSFCCGYILFLFVFCDSLLHVIYIYDHEL